jgi:hypothetical protein
MAPGELNNVLESEEPLLGRGDFLLLGSLDPKSPQVQDPALVGDLGNNLWVVKGLETAELEPLVQSEITKLNDEFSVDEQGGISIGDSMSIAREIVAPGSGASDLVLEAVEPIVDTAKGAVGLGEGAQVRSIAQDLSNQGVSPDTFDPRSDQLRSLISSRGPNLVPPEALEMDASMASADDDVLESSGLSDGSLASELSESVERRGETQLPARENVGTSYSGPVEGVTDDFVLQRVGDDLVSHRAELFDEHELSLGKPLQITYEHDGPSVKPADLSRELGIGR